MGVAVSSLADVLYVVQGTDEGLVQEQARVLYQRLTGGVDDEFTHEIVRGQVGDSESAYQVCMQVVSSLQTLSLFGAEKVVWLKQVTFLADDVTGNAERTLSGLEKLRDFLQSGEMAGARLIISASQVDKRRSFWQFLHKNANVLSFDKIDTSRDGWQVQVGKIVEQRAAELGLRFERDALELFVNLAGESTQQIRNELQKIDIYLGDRREISRADVVSLVPMSRVGVIFEIGNALQKGDGARALELIDEQLESGEQPIALIRATLIPTIRNLLISKLLLEKYKPSARDYRSFCADLDRLSSQERGWLPLKKDGGVNTFGLFQTIPAAEWFTRDGLIELTKLAMQADLALVTTSQNPRMILQRLVAQMMFARKKRKVARR